MFSALLQEDSLDMSAIDLASTPAGGFGKMLNSLQGLQQRLDGFSITDVTNAEANAHTLTMRLRQFQDTITAVALLKSATVKVSRSIAEIAAFDTNVVNLDSLENHPQLHAIVKASKLIKLQKLMRALKAGAEVGGPQEDQFHDEISAVLPTVELAAIRQDESLLATVGGLSKGDLTSSPGEFEESAEPSQTLETNAANIYITVASPVLESAVDTPILEFTATQTTTPGSLAVIEFPTADAEFETAAAAALNTLSPAEAVFREDFQAPADQFTESLFKATISQPPQTEAAKQQKSHANGKKPLNASTTSIPANESFDLRLLDDLVSNYGEFAGNPYLPATIEKNEIQSFEPAANLPEEFQSEWPNPVEAAAPQVKKNGELDRQLKKIIKDYGENDLYAHKQTINIKKAGILAFVFLGLVFGVIYFFKAPPSAGKTFPAATNTTRSATQDNHTSQPGAHGPSGERSLGSTPHAEKPTAKINN